MSKRNFIEKNFAIVGYDAQCAMMSNVEKVCFFQMEDNEEENIIYMIVHAFCIYYF